MKKIKAVYLSAEMNPYAKTGGLADVAGALPEALRKKRVDIISVMPKYGIIDKPLKYVCDFPVKIGDMTKTCIIRSDPDAFSPVYFVDSYDYFERNGIYGFYDDGIRYAFFCLAVIEFLRKINFAPDLIHLNDWHTGPVAMLLKEKYQNDTFFEKTKILFSIHNLRYQGLFGKDMLSIFDVSENAFTPKGAEYFGKFNYIKAGISYADHISTVSRTYANEILTARYGEGQDGLLRERQDVLTGIVNGIDTDDFDPMNDDDIYYPFSWENIEDKIKNKKALLSDLGLKNHEYPVFSIISRLDDQKGLNLVLEGFEKILAQKEKVILILLGTGDRYYEDSFLRLKEKYPDRVSVNIAFDLKLAKQIYAGSDIFLMPSKFEPCGLGQMIAMRYGTIPVVRKTGGLVDTVIDVCVDKVKGCGFVFNEMEEEAFLGTVTRAIGYYNKKNKWTELIIKTMKIDNSWNNAAVNYLTLYKEIIDRK